VRRGPGAPLCLAGLVAVRNFRTNLPSKPSSGSGRCSAPSAAVTIAFRKLNGCRQALFSFSITSNFGIDPERERSSSAAAFGAAGIARKRSFAERSGFPLASPSEIGMVQLADNSNPRSTRTSRASGQPLSEAKGSATLLTCPGNPVTASELGKILESKSLRKSMCLNRRSCSGCN
jgi:hypothetical protein